MQTIRQKAANEQAVKKLEGFLLSLKLDLDEGNPGNFSARQKKFNVSNSTTAACKALGFIKKEGSKYVWAEGEANRTKALLILDFFLKNNKKTMRGQIMPDFEALTHTLNNILEKFTILTVQNEVGLKRLKQGNNAVADTDIFRVEDQRLYLAGQIAAGLYPTLLKRDEGFVNSGMETNFERKETDYKELNKTIVLATDDLFNKLLNK